MRDNMRKQRKTFLFICAFAILLTYSFVFSNSSQRVISAVQGLSVKVNNSFGFIPSLLGNVRMQEHFPSRIQLVANVCRNASTEGFKPNRRHSKLLRKNWIFYYSPTRDLLLEWCPVYKAASSPWMATFAQLSKFLTPHTESMIHSGKTTFIKLMRDFRLNVQKKKSMKSYRMLIVRHPFERILSAFRDKLERVRGREFYHRTIGYQIMGFSLGEQLFHLNPIADYHPPSFQQFLQYLLHSNPASMDEHWIPSFINCNPCQTPFDLILKVETMEEDKQRILNLLGIQSEEYKGLMKIWSRWSNKSTKNDTLAHAYYSQISRNDLKAIYNIYQLDFQFFGYDPEPYFNMAK